MTDVTYDELRGMAVAVTDANTKAKAKAEKREPSLPDGWSRARIISNLVEMMVDVPDDHGAMLNRYQATLQEIQRDRRVEDPEVQLPTELVNQIKEDPLFAHLSDGNLVLVASSWFALEEIWWALFREEPDDPFES